MDPGGGAFACRHGATTGAPPTAKALEQKALALAAMPALLDTLQDLARPALQGDLDVYLAGQRERVQAALAAQGG